MPGHKAEARINAVAYYQKPFKELYDDWVTLENIGKVIAAFERTIISDSSAFDQYIAGDKSAMNALVAFMGALSQTPSSSSVHRSQRARLSIFLSLSNKLTYSINHT